MIPFLPQIFICAFIDYLSVEHITLYEVPLWAVGTVGPKASTSLSAWGFIIVEEIDMGPINTQVKA